MNNKQREGIMDKIDALLDKEKLKTWERHAVLDGVRRFYIYLSNKA